MVSEVKVALDSSFCWIVGAALGSNEKIFKTVFGSTTLWERIKFLASLLAKVHGILGISFLLFSNKIGPHQPVLH